mmetsp:Transcript_48153/g.103757  ORF Transcript_48153/g.103757 Transcript_48153/m.103757 type:complete len:234 (+) Transcript_48153:44-745(+)
MADRTLFMWRERKTFLEFQDVNFFRGGSERRSRSQGHVGHMFRDSGLDWMCFPGNLKLRSKASTERSPSRNSLQASISKSRNEDEQPEPLPSSSTTAASYKEPPPALSSSERALDDGENSFPGQDSNGRVGLMIKNIGCRCSSASLESILNSAGLGQFGKVYVPRRASSRGTSTNFGYGFVECSSYEQARLTFERLHEKSIVFGTVKRTIRVAVAHHQCNDETAGLFNCLVDM